MSSKKSKSIEIDSHKCTACWQCVAICPNKALGKVKILWHRHVRFASSENCIGCGKCINTCPKNVFNKIN